MTESCKPPAPSGPSFAERVARLSQSLRLQEIPGAMLSSSETATALDLLACIREQQAALQLLVNSCDTQIRNKDGEQMGVRAPDRLTVAQARAVLAKYALEVKP